MYKSKVKVKIDDSKFEQFLEKITTDIAKCALESILETGEEIAKSKYAGKGISVYTDANEYNGEIIANGEHVAYLEYGTGVRGKGSYQGELYDDQISFTPTNQPGGNNETITLDGWTYNYRKEALGWTEKDYVGQVAGQQMFDTSEELIDYIEDKNGLAMDIKEKVQL